MILFGNRFFINHPNAILSLTEKTRTLPKSFGCFGSVRLEIFYSLTPAAMSSYPSVGLCDGGHLWLRQNPAAMSSLWGQVGKGMGSMAAARFYLPSPIVASRHREARSDPFTTDSRKIYFQKKHQFHFQLLTRQQTTTVDYKRLFNGLVLTRVASLPR